MSVSVITIGPLEYLAFDTSLETFNPITYHVVDDITEATLFDTADTAKAAAECTKACCPDISAKITVLSLEPSATMSYVSSFQPNKIGLMLTETTGMIVPVLSLSVGNIVDWLGFEWRVVDVRDYGGKTGVTLFMVSPMFNCAWEAGNYTYDIFRQVPKPVEYINSMPYELCSEAFYRICSITGLNSDAFIRDTETKVYLHLPTKSQLDRGGYQQFSRQDEFQRDRRSENTAPYFTASLSSDAVLYNMSHCSDAVVVVNAFGEFVKGKNGSHAVSGFRPIITLNASYNALARNGVI